MKTPLLQLAFVSIALLVPGCGKKDGAAPGNVTPLRETSFTEVTSQLDPGGTVYGYLATDQWLSGLHTNVAAWSELVSTFPGVDPSDRENVRVAMDSLAHIIETSGVEHLTGVGFSGIQITPELHRTKLVLHHRSGKGDGIFWNVLGRKSHALDGLNLLTTNTAVAAFGDVDVPMVWETLAAELENSGVPDVAQTLTNWPVWFEEHTQIAWANFLESLGGEVGMVITLDESHPMPVPFSEGLHVPEPGLLLVVKVKDDALYNVISSKMKDSGMARLTDEKELKVTAIRVPIPMPLDLELTVASTKGYLFVASSSALVRGALDCANGRQPGLRERADVAELLKYLPSDGNQFFYVDRRFMGTIQSVQKALLAKGDSNAAQSQLIDRLMLSQKPAFGMAVGRRTTTGWESVCVGSQDSATAFLAAPAVGGAAMISAMVVPAIAKMKAQAESAGEQP
ncbi:MAG TPA: hypothetical protein VEH04_12980 [Verrucomicrobiae bacterium]|nr:hypothetical protein [Verrucomicrobiae bacterium]